MIHIKERVIVYVQNHTNNTLYSRTYPRSDSSD